VARRVHRPVHDLAVTALSGSRCLEELAARTALVLAVWGRLRVALRGAERAFRRAQSILIITGQASAAAAEGKWQRCPEQKPGRLPHELAPHEAALPEGSGPPGDPALSQGWRPHRHESPGP
jgi:hypothetical protein